MRDYLKPAGEVLLGVGIFFLIPLMLAFYLMLILVDAFQLLGKTAFDELKKLKRKKP